LKAAKVVGIFLAAIALIGCMGCGEQPTDGGGTGIKPGPQLLRVPTVEGDFVYFVDNGGADLKPSIYHYFIDSTDVKPGIYRMPLEGGKPTLIVEGGVLPKVSGQSLAFLYPYQALMIQDLVTHEQTEVFRGDVVGAAWFAADTILYGIFGGDIMMKCLSSGDAVKLFDDGLGLSSNGREIVFTRWIQLKNAYIDTSLLVLYDLYDGREHVIDRSAEYIRHPAISADGRLIAAVRHNTNSIEIFNVSSNTWSHNLATNADDPCWTPDGKIVYVQLNDRDGTKNGLLYMMNADGSGKRQIVSWDDLR
jgi:hypothetical protein